MLLDELNLAQLRDALVGAGLVPPELASEAEQALRLAWDAEAVVGWGVADVRDLCPGLDEDAARQVLRRVSDLDCDSAIGEMIHAAARELYGHKAFSD